MDDGLVADLRKLNLMERPKNLPAELEGLCASAERRAFEVKRLEVEEMINSPEYMSVEAALRIAVDDLKEYRTETGWDTAKFTEGHPPEAPVCTGYPCTPWMEGREPESFLFVFKSETHNNPAYTGVDGVNRDPYAMKGETHFRPSAKDPFGKGVSDNDFVGLPMGSGFEMKPSLPSRRPGNEMLYPSLPGRHLSLTPEQIKGIFGTGDHPVIGSSDALEAAGEYLLEGDKKPSASGDKPRGTNEIE